jgi:non-heme chloroperoxidase
LKEVITSALGISAIGNDSHMKESFQMSDPETKAMIRTDDGTTLSYRTRGDGPRKLLFVHGWGGAGTGFFWNELIEALDLSGLRVILADLRGHGESDKAATGYTTERFAQDMFAVADAAGAERLVLVAYSMSGRWGQWMACTQPERVVGQILIAPVPAADIPFPDEVKEQWLQVAREKTMATFDPWVHQFTHARLRPEILQAYFDSLTTTPELSLGATLDMCRQQGQFMDRLSAIRAATLVIGGRHDPMLPPEVLRQAIVNPIAGARLATLDCGHEIPLEQPQETAALIEAFLAGLR